MYAWWLVLGTLGGASGGFLFSPLLDSPWWLLPGYVAAVYAFKRAVTRLAEWWFAPQFWWQATSMFLAAFVLACVACVVLLLTTSTWIGLPIIIVASFIIGLFHNLFRVVFVRHQFTWWYLAPLFAILATVAGWLLLQTHILDRSNPASTAIAGTVIGFLYPVLTTILLRLMWNLSAAHAKLGTIYFDKEENFQEALILHNNAIALKPNDPTLYAARASTCLKQGETDRANVDVEQALTLDPQCAEARVLRAVMMTERGEVDAAIAELDELVNHKLDLYPAYLNRARAYSQKGDFERALNDYARAAQLGDDPALSLAYRADTYYRMGDYDAAIADCDRVQVTQTMTCFVYPMILITRGKCYLAKGDDKRGFGDLWSGLQRTNIPALVNEAEQAFNTLSKETLQKHVSELHRRDF